MIFLVAAAVGQMSDLLTFQMFYASKVELNPFAVGLASTMGVGWVIPFKLALGAILFALVARLRTSRRRQSALVWISSIGFFGAAGNVGIITLTI